MHGMDSKLRLIGVAGTNGSGKDTIGYLLSKKYGFWFISLTDILRDECRRRNLPVERVHLRTISAEWRRQYGLGVMVDKCMDAFNALPDKYKYVGVVMSSFRNPYENDRMHELGGQVVWLDADPKIRYDRIQANAASRHRKAEDTKTFEQFMAEEEAEMHPPAGADAATLNMAAVKEKADLFLKNDSGQIEVFEKDMLAGLGIS